MKPTGSTLPLFAFGGISGKSTYNGPSGSGGFWSGEQINPRWISKVTALVTRTWAWLEVLTSLPVSILPLVFPFPFHLCFPALVGQADFSPTHHCHPDALAHLRPKGRSWLTAKPLSMCRNKTLTATGCFSSGVWDKGETNRWMWWFICLNPTFCEMWKPVVPLSHSLTPRSRKDFSAERETQFLSRLLNETQKNPIPSRTSEAWLVWQKITSYWYICVFMYLFFWLCVCTCITGHMWSSGNKVQKLSLSSHDIGPRGRT